MNFSKYRTRGAYHWDQIGKNPIKSNAYVKGRYELCVDMLKKNIKSPAKVLDLGCGDGALTYLLYKEGFLTTGIDTNQLGVDLAKKKFLEKSINSDFYCMDSRDLLSERFDAVVCSDVIEHVDDPLFLINDINRLLKPNGVAVISTPIRITEYPLDQEHIVEWFPSEFENLFNGFEVEFYKSHSVALMDMMNNKWLRLIINLTSMISNPFLWNNPQSLRYFSLQYACVKKKNDF